MQSVLGVSIYSRLRRRLCVVSNATGQWAMRQTRSRWWFGGNFDGGVKIGGWRAKCGPSPLPSHVSNVERRTPGTVSGPLSIHLTLTWQGDGDSTQSTSHSKRHTATRGKALVVRVFVVVLYVPDAPPAPSHRSYHYKPQPGSKEDALKRPVSMRKENPILVRASLPPSLPPSLFLSLSSRSIPRIRCRKSPCRVLPPNPYPGNQDNQKRQVKSV